jgi:hypothetical protein
MSLGHRIAHWLGWNRCEIAYTDERVDGHVYCMLECVTCGERKPFFHSMTCDCQMPGWPR